MKSSCVDRRKESMRSVMTSTLVVLVIWKSRSSVCDSGDGRVRRTDHITSTIQEHNCDKAGTGSGVETKEAALALQVHTTHSGHWVSGWVG